MHLAAKLGTMNHSKHAFDGEAREQGEAGVRSGNRGGPDVPRRTNPFQNLTASLVAALQSRGFRVEESVLMRNPKTGAVRELDILATHKTDPNQTLLVECRDHGRRQNVQWIDELEGKMRRLGFSHAVAVSSSGFTKPAVAEGRERGISTLHLREAESLDWGDWRFGLERLGVTMPFDPEVKKTAFFTRGPLPPNIDSQVDSGQAYFFDTEKRTRIKVSDWIKGFQADACTAEKFPKGPEPNTIQHYDCTIPCDPQVCLQIGEQLFPLEKVVLSIDRANADYQVPLRHYRFGDEKFHVGHLDILGRPTRLVVLEGEDGSDRLNVMVEQLVHVDDDRYQIDTTQAELSLTLDDGSVITCPVLADEAGEAHRVPVSNKDAAQIAAFFLGKPGKTGQVSNPPAAPGSALDPGNAQTAQETECPSPGDAPVEPSQSS